MIAPLPSAARLRATALSILTVCLLLAVHVTTVHGDTSAKIQDDAEEESDEKSTEKPAEKSLPGTKPKFAVDANGETFDEAVALFLDEKWKAAQKLFKASQAGESSDVKRGVKAWLTACKGGPQLKPVDKAINKSQWKVAWQKIEKVRYKYGETPLQEKIGDLRATIEKQLFVKLATFEEDGPKSQENTPRSEKSKINEDMKFVSEGKRSLYWNPGKVGLGGGQLFARLPIATIDGEMLAEHPYLHMSFFATKENAGRFTLFLDTGDNVVMNPLQTRSFFFHQSMEKPGWHHVRLDLRKQFQKYSNPELHEVQQLAILIIPPANPKAIYIDDVKLEKK